MTSATPTDQPDPGGESVLAAPETQSGDLFVNGEIGLTVGAVARRLGVASATLRTWARRYGLTASLQTAGSHRRYTEADCERLLQVQRLVNRGVPLASAAAAVLRGAVVPAADADGHSGDVETEGRRGGGQVIPLPNADATTRGLARAAAALDSGECARLMSSAIAKRGVIATWNELIRPVLNSIGLKWEQTEQGVEVEHALSHAIIAVFAHAGERLVQPVNERPVVLACVEHEQHSLPLYAIYAALAEQGIASRVLGARVPADSLARAIERTGPAAVISWCQLPENADPNYLGSLPRTRPPVKVIAAGPGWAAVDTGTVPVMADLTETVQQVRQALKLI